MSEPDPNEEFAETIKWLLEPVLEDVEKRLSGLQDGLRAELTRFRKAVTDEHEDLSRTACDQHEHREEAATAHYEAATAHYQAMQAVPQIVADGERILDLLAEASETRVSAAREAQEILVTAHRTMLTSLEELGLKVNDLGELAHAASAGVTLAAPHPETLRKLDHLTDRQQQNAALTARVRNLLVAAVVAQLVTVGVCVTLLALRLHG
jgi:hypothetical protein